MSNARNLSKFKPSSSGLVETADIADDAVSTDQIANNATINTSGAITTTGAFTSVGIDDNADATAITIDSSENVGLGTTTPATSLEISGTTENTQGGVFPRIQISTTSDVNPTYSGSLDIVEKQSSATSTAVFGENHLYGFRMMLDGFNNILKWFSGSQTTVTERMGLARDTGNLTLNTGNLVIGTSGKGIDFSANTESSVSGVSNQSELFDYYEEGTWTPTITGGSNPSYSTSVASGKYIKVGTLVFVQWNMIITGVTSQGSGNAQVGGLPYASNCNTYQGHIGIMYNDVWDTEVQKGYVPNGQSHIQLAPTGRTQSNFGFGSTLGTGYFGGGGCYITG